MTRAVLLSACLLAATVRAADLESTVPGRKLAASDAGTLWSFGAQRVLVLRGTPREMGLAHGRLLRTEVRENLHAFLDEWAIGRRGRTREELAAIWKRLSPHVPRRYHEELAGLAEGAGVPLADLELLHAIPSRYHCTGTAVLKALTRDGAVYHTRSLDYSLDIGETVRPQTNALLYVAAPKGGIPHAIVSWAGFVGCVTGMNAAGVSVGEMGSSSSDESYDGIPMIFHLREVLWRARDLEQAKRIWEQGPRTCGFNFVFCDREHACAVESNRSRVRFFAPGDEAENVAPHYALPGIVRRCNHFVDPGLAATQRERYDPRKSAPGSWMAYEHQGEYLKRRAGRIDAAAMIGLLRTYPATHPCLHQAVMVPTRGAIWVSHARDPAEDPLAGAQNQPFYRYELAGLLRGEPQPARVLAAGRDKKGGVETGRCPDAPAIEGPFGHPPAPFRWRLETIRTLGKVTISHLSYPSPGPTRFPENETVHAEYYRPQGEGPFRSVVVLHILDGRFYVARLVANALAQQGVAALFVQLPLYGDRRPRAPLDLRRFDLPDVVPLFFQAVRDVRRGAAWLRARPELDAGHVGIFGPSLGAFAAEMAAGADRGFDRCLFLLGGGSLVDVIYSGSREVRKARAVLDRKGWTRERVAEVLAPLDMTRLAGGIDREGVLMINCRADEVVPPDSTVAYWKALSEPEIIWYDGGHYGLKDHVFEVLGRITAHFTKP